MMDPVLLSRIQFGLTAMFHYIYPPISIGLGVLLVFMEGMFLATRRPVYESMAKFWGRVFGLVFAMGVATGIVMEFQFGTNWSNYSRFVGDVFGSALAAEGVFAFFLESGFLAVMLFGWNRVGRVFHFVSTCLVSFGAMLSAVWIIVANSWQQTPAGHRIVTVNGMQRAEVVDFWQVVFNPSTVARLSHTLMGAWILGAFFVMSVCAYYILRRKHEDFARRGFIVALIWATVVSLAQLGSGHYSAMVVAKHQPAKLAAFEGLFKTEPYTPLALIGWPDENAAKTHFEIGIPGGLSFLVHQDFKTPVTGLDKFARQDWPPVKASFFTYHIMIALGTAFIGLTLLTLFLWWRGWLFNQKWLMAIYVIAVIGPMIANQTGWMAAEFGRQPWVVYGLMRTQQGASVTVPAWQILVSILLFVAIYSLMFLLFMYLLWRKVEHGPDPYEEAAGEEPETKPAGLLDALARRGGELRKTKGAAKSAAVQSNGGTR